MVNVKIILLGDEGVGKTSLLKTYCGGTGISGIGVDFGVKSIEKNNISVRLQFWDVSQDPRFDSVRDLYYRRAKAVLFLYDITRPETFEHISDWIELISSHISNSTIFFLIGNKVDLEEYRAIKQETAEKFSKRYPNFVLFKEISIKTGQNVQKMLESLAQILIEKKKTETWL